MSSSNNQFDNNDLAQVAIPKKLLETLVSTGFIHGNDCRCLNGVAKKVIWQALLNSSVK